MYVCVCRGITEADVRGVGSRGVVAPEALIRVLGLDAEDCCGRCSDQIHEFVELAWEGALSAGHAPATDPRRTALALPADRAC